MKNLIFLLLILLFASCEKEVVYPHCYTIPPNTKIDSIHYLDSVYIEYYTNDDRGGTYKSVVAKVEYVTRPRYHPDGSVDSTHTTIISINGLIENGTGLYYNSYYPMVTVVIWENDVVALKPCIYGENMVWNSMNYAEIGYSFMDKTIYTNGMMSPISDAYMCMKIKFK